MPFCDEETEVQTVQQFAEGYAINFGRYINHRSSHSSYKTIILNTFIDLCMLDILSITF